MDTVFECHVNPAGCVGNQCYNSMQLPRYLLVLTVLVLLEDEVFICTEIAGHLLN